MGLSGLTPMAKKSIPAFIAWTECARIVAEYIHH
jgi:hypothetical protein